MIEFFAKSTNHFSNFGTKKVLQTNNIEHHQLVGLEPGSVEAKKAWAAIDAKAHSPESIMKAKSMGWYKATGLYQGKPLVKGPGEGHGDYNFLVDKLIYDRGYSPEIANKIAAKIKQNLGG